MDFRIERNGLLASFLALLPAVTVAQSFPAKPIRILVPFPAGASLDLSARVIGQKVAESINQPVIIENRAGGNTIVAAEAVARAPADGYTLLQTLDTTFTLVPAAYKKIPYDPLRDFAPVTQSSRAAYLIAGSSRAPYRSLTELVAFARANPGKINIGASTSLTQILALLLKSSAGIEVTYVPYKGTPPMLQGLASGEIDLIIDAIPLYLPGMKAGKTIALATTANTRAPQLPDMPTFREAGYPTVDSNAWFGFFAPKGMPRPAIDRIHKDVAEIMADRAMQEKEVAAKGYNWSGAGPDEFADFIRKELADRAAVVRISGAKPE